MNIQLDMPSGLEEELRVMVLTSTQEALRQFEKSLVSKEWMSLKEAQDYLGVSNATFSKFRKMGLKVMVVDSVNRVSKKELNDFMEKNSY